MKEIEAEVRTCQLCRLAKTRTNAVPGEGSITAEVMFIGEGPGYHEDKQGRPFIGQAGQFLNELLGMAGLSRESVFIANVVKCRPPNNRDPLPDEIAACAPYLERQIEAVDPRVIVTLGRFSMASFFPGERISQIHGTARMVGGRMCVAMYHPAAGLHQASLADVIRIDFKKLPVYMEEARRLATPPPEMVDERIEEAVEARMEVVGEPETSAVIDLPAANAETESQTSLLEAQAGPTTVRRVTAPENEVAAARREARKRGRKQGENEEGYRQMPLFEM